MENNKYEIHISDIRSFLTCRRQWNWSSNLREGLEAKVPYMPFFTGRGIHWCLEQWYEEGTPAHEALPTFVSRELENMDELWGMEQDAIAEQVELMHGILEHYMEWAPRDRGLWADENLEFLALETEYSVPIRTPSGRASPRVFLAGRFDGLVRRRDNGTLWLWETKTTRSIDNLVNSLFNDLQAGAYILAAQEITGEKVLGVLYNLMRKKVPTVPRVLQSGDLSRNKSIDTTANAYLLAAKKHHQDMDTKELIQYYGDMLQHLLDKGNTFFRRVPVRRTKHELDQLTEDLHTIALEMVRPTTPIYPTPAWNSCTFCRFKAPCIAMNTGSDYEHILETEYRPRREWDSLEGREEQA